jgi:hypothetical protein
MNHWTKGRLSGYPICCIIHFYVRFLLIKAFGLKFIRFFERSNNNCGYVQCLFHNLLFKLDLYRIEKYVCPECGWMQVNSNTCNIKHLHDTWVVDEIREYYKRQIKDGGAIFIRQPGAIARKIEKEFKRKSIRRRK